MFQHVVPHMQCKTCIGIALVAGALIGIFSVALAEAGRRKRKHRERQAEYRRVEAQAYDQDRIWSESLEVAERLRDPEHDPDNLFGTGHA